MAWLFWLYLTGLYRFSCAIKSQKSKSGSGLIIGKIKLREKNGQPMIYWRAIQNNGKVKQEQFYWGERPRQKIERLIHHLNHRPSRYAHKIGRMIGLKSSDLPIKHLGNSFFFRNHILIPLRTSTPSRFRVDYRIHPPGKLNISFYKNPKPSLKHICEKTALKLLIKLQELDKENHPRTWDKMILELFLYEISGRLRNCSEIIEKREHLVLKK